MTVVLALVALVLYLRFEAQIDDTFNQGLRSRAGDVSALLQDRPPQGLADPGRSILVERGESFAQILDSRGVVLDATPTLRGASLLTPAQVSQALEHTIIFQRPNPFEAVEPARLLATRVTARGRRLVVVVGAGADDRNSAVAGLALLLAIGMPVALLLASVAGYGVASAALGPVEAMRRKADEITEHAPGERLPVSAVDDEIARLGTTLNRMLARLEGALERERAFVADASHELRTPLSILKTEIELALHDGRTREELVAALQSAAEETDRLGELAEALLVIARADGGRLPLTTSEIDVARLLDGVGVRFAARARAAGRSLVVADAGDARLQGDPRRLEQALDNLVENALKHGAGPIHLEATAVNGHVLLVVRDEGPGFPPAFVDHAFERFTRADPGRARGGSGLGLSIVLLIARAHDGDAVAANHPDGGAQVTIDLPAGSGRVQS
jgi:signal transduction histidine kinase